MMKKLLWRDIRYWLHMDIIILCPGIMINLLRMRRLRDGKIAMYGHTHMPVIENEDGILVINPGSLTYRVREAAGQAMQLCR